MKIYSVIESKVDSELLQNDLNSIVHWCTSNGLVFNVKKCKVVSYTKKAIKSISDYFINDYKIDRDTTMKDLGIIFDQSLSFNNHIDYVITTSLKTMGFIIRSTKGMNNIVALKSLYYGLVRSRLEYGTVIWNPQYKNNKLKLENIQRKFVKHLHFKQLGTYPTRNTQQSILLEMFDIKSLYYRRTRYFLSFLYNVVNNNIDCQCLLSQICLHVPRFNARQSEFFKIKFARTNLGRRTPLNNMVKVFNDYCLDRDIYFDTFKIIASSIEHLYYVSF